MKALFTSRIQPGSVDVADILLHIKMVACIVLSVALFAAVILFGMILYISNEPGASYIENFFNYGVTMELLQPALIVSGLFIIVVTAGLTWLIAIYTSFRIAGPLYRISEDLKISIDSGVLPKFNFRMGDSLETQMKEIRRSFELYKIHRMDTEHLRKQVLHALSKENPNIGAALKALAKLRKEVKRVRT